MFSGALLVAAVVAYALWRISALRPRVALGWVDVGLALEARLLTRCCAVAVPDRGGERAIWVPIGVWIGLRPWASTRVQPVAQFLAAFPANVLFPIAVVLIVAFRLDPNIWLSPLMVLGTQ